MEVRRPLSVHAVQAVAILLDSHFSSTPMLHRNCRRPSLKLTNSGIALGKKKLLRLLRVKLKTVEIWNNKIKLREEWEKAQGKGDKRRSKWGRVSDSGERREQFRVQLLIPWVFIQSRNSHPRTECPRLPPPTFKGILATAFRITSHHQFPVAYTFLSWF